MNIGIVGAGSMGLLFAHFLKNAGYDVVLLENDVSAVKILEEGLLVRDGCGFIRHSLTVSSSPNILSASDIVFIFVKAYSTESAASSIQSSVTPGSIIVSLQNGLGNDEILRKYFDEGRIVYGSTSIGSSRSTVNTVIPGGIGETVIGGIRAQAVSTVRGVFIACTLPLTVTDNPAAALWKKAIINGGINPIAAILGIRNGAIIENRHAAGLQSLIVSEGARVAAALGVAIDGDEMISRTREVCEKTTNNRCSMLQDLDAGGMTEIDSINGKIIEYGKRKGVPTPYNETVYLLVKAREKKQNDETLPRQRNAREGERTPVESE